MAKKGVSAVSGSIIPVVGEKYDYKIASWYPATPASEKNPAKVTWELFKKRKNGKFTSTNIKKIGKSDFTFGEAAAGETYRLEAYLYKPEGGGLIITPEPAKIPKINKVELFYVDDTKGTLFSFMEKFRARANCVNMLGKELVFTLWEDDAKGKGHSASNRAIDTKRVKVNRDGIAVAEFSLTIALMLKAAKGESDNQLEFYVTVEYFKNKKHATDNVNVKNPFPQKSGSSNPAPKTKAPNSPASQKPPSKKEEAGILDAISDKVGELWDWWESPGIATKDRKPTVQKQSGKSPTIIKGTDSIKGTCICDVRKLYWGKNFSCEERKKIIDISTRLLCNPDYLTSAMALETGGTFDPSIVNSLGYTGLIQIGSTAATDINRRKGTNISAGNNGNLKKMSVMEQLNYVEYYLEPFKGKLNTLADFYLAILMPVDCGKGAVLNHVVFDKNLVLNYNKKGEVVKNTRWVRQRAYAQNPVFHKEGKNEKGKTYVWEIAEEIQKWYDKGPNNKESTFTCQKTTPSKPEKNKSGLWHNPVDNPRLTKYNYSGSVKPASGTYGNSRRKSDGSKKYHSGLDLFAIPGKEKVYSCVKGNIHQVRFSPSAGWIVRVKIQNVQDLLDQEKKVNYKTQFVDELKGIDIKKSDDVFLIYMHLDSVSVSKEDAASKKEIGAGFILGYAGVSGSIASGGRAPHLHLEIATVLDAYGKGPSVRTNPARFVKLNSHDTKDQEDAAKKAHIYHKK